MNHAFFIVCRMTEDSDEARFGNPGKVEKKPVIETLKWNLAGLRKHHPESKVYIIDSNSPNQTYHLEVEEEFNVKVDYAKNNNYTVGAIKHAYENYPDIEFYYFLQDSQRVNGDLSDLMNHEISTCSYFNSHKGIHRSRPGREFGFDRQENIDDGDRWLKERTKIKDGIPEIFTGCWGSIMYCRRSVLEKLDSIGYFNLLPENKHHDHMLERLTGVCLEYLGYDLKKSSLKSDRNRILKKFRART